MTTDDLARFTAQEFAAVRKEMSGLATEMGGLATKESVRLLDEKVDNGFAAIRHEMHENTRVILAAIETVEYTKLRIRLDTLETRVDTIERTGKK